MFALKDADFADIIGQYLANLANTGLALSGDQVFPWVLEYYAKDDEKEIAEKEQEEKKMDFIVQKTHWIVSAIIRIGKIPCIT